MTKLTVYRSFPQGSEKNQIAFEEFRSWIRSGKIFKHLFRYKSVELITSDLKYVYSPFLSSLLVWALSRGKTFRKDAKGHVERIDIPFLFKLFKKWVESSFKRRAIIKKIEREVLHLSANLKKNSLQKGNPIYLRTDFFFGLQAGGSVGHIAGVLNHLKELTHPPIFLTSDRIPTVDPSIETHIIEPGDVYWDFRELPPLQYTATFTAQALQILKNKKPSFIYQRYSINNFSGVQLAQTLKIPLILEFNGSEIWVNRNWGSPLQFEDIAEKIETLNLKAADWIVVVSKPLKTELVRKGIDSNKILVNPNGVNPEKYHPDVDGSKVRQLFGPGDWTLIGFIGTFGAWHGAEVLAEAFAKLLHQFPEYKKKVRLLMIGNGPKQPLSRQILEKAKCFDFCFFTGSIPQEEGPPYLAACDILISPQIPNADGTPFFGSPTKLFEYMAMGKGIIASDLDQIGEILEHKHSAYLVKPGDVDSLVLAMKTLIDQPDLRKEMGKNAREEVITRYSWKEHTRKILQVIDV